MTFKIIKQIYEVYSYQVLKTLFFLNTPKTESVDYVMWFRDHKSENGLNSNLKQIEMCHTYIVIKLMFYSEVTWKYQGLTYTLF